MSGACLSRIAGFEFQPDSGRLLCSKQTDLLQIFTKVFSQTTLSSMNSFSLGPVLNSGSLFKLTYFLVSSMKSLSQLLPFLTLRLCYGFLFSLVLKEVLQNMVT